MPVGTLKNTLYGMALPMLGKRCEWTPKRGNALEELLRCHYVQGTCIQRFENGKLTEGFAVGLARLGEDVRSVTPDTVFRTASVSKMVTALLVFRLQTKGMLDVEEDISDLWDRTIRNPLYGDTPITLGMLLSHTSSIVDASAYFASFSTPVPLDVLFENSQIFSATAPGTSFQYSNFAAGLIACLLEKRFGESFEVIVQRELFRPLGVEATFDLKHVLPEHLSDSYRVLPPKISFDARARQAVAKPLDMPDPDHHYLLASGNLYLTASVLARLALTAWNGGDGFLDTHSLRQMQTPLLGWPEKAVPMRHGMGLLKLENAPLWGHQGFAYGAVNGVFFDGRGNGFASLNNGASERRLGHLALLNRDLIRLFLPKEGEERWM